MPGNLHHRPLSSTPAPVPNFWERENFHKSRLRIAIVFLLVTYFFLYQPLVTIYKIRCSLVRNLNPMYRPSMSLFFFLMLLFVFLLFPWRIDRLMLTNRQDFIIICWHTVETGTMFQAGPWAPINCPFIFTSDFYSYLFVALSTPSKNKITGRTRTAIVFNYLACEFSFLPPPPYILHELLKWWYWSSWKDCISMTHSKECFFFCRIMQAGFAYHYSLRCCNSMPLIDILQWFNHGKRRSSPHVLL